MILFLKEVVHITPIIRIKLKHNIIIVILFMEMCIHFDRKKINEISASLHDIQSMVYLDLNRLHFLIY